MFSKQSLFVILETDEIFRVEIDAEAQIEVCSLLSDGAKQLKENKEHIEFNGSYKPERNEVLFISNFEFDAKINNAIKDPIGITAFIPKENTPRIKAVFMGKYSTKNRKNDYTIAFQRFKKEQYITKIGVNIFHDSNTFVQEKRFGICITDNVDCVIVNDVLFFTSFHYARQVFDLSNYYREATDTEIDAFITNKNIYVENTITFKDNADSIVRRKIALINDSGFFTKFDAKYIVDKGREYGFNIPMRKKKIAIPSDKKELKNMLKFFDNEIYRGAFSDEVFETNSKRKIML